PGGNCQPLSHSPSLVHHLFPAQSRFLPRLHHRAQFQALSHPRIPTHPAFLVLRSDPAGRLCALDPSSGLVRPPWGFARVAATPPLRRHASCSVLGRFLPRVLLHLQIQASGLHSARSSCDRSASLQSIFAPSSTTGKGVSVDACLRCHCVHSASAVVLVRAHRPNAIPTKPNCRSRIGLIATWNRNFPLWHKKNRNAEPVCLGFTLRNPNTRASSPLQPPCTDVYAMGSLRKNTRARIACCSNPARAYLRVRHAAWPAVQRQFLSASGDSDMGSRP